MITAEKPWSTRLSNPSAEDCTCTEVLDRYGKPFAFFLNANDADAMLEAQREIKRLEEEVNSLELQIEHEIETKSTT